MTNMNDIVSLSPEMVLDELIIEMYDALHNTGRIGDTLDYASFISEMFDFHVPINRVQQTLRAYKKGRN